MEPGLYQAKYTKRKSHVKDMCWNFPKQWNSEYYFVFLRNVAKTKFHDHGSGNVPHASMHIQVLAEGREGECESTRTRHNTRTTHIGVHLQGKFLCLIIGL